MQKSNTRSEARYLIKEGHREIAFAGDTSLSLVQRRFDGYQQAIREKRLKSVLLSDRNSENFITSRQEIAQRIFSRKAWRSASSREITFPRGY